MYEAIMAFLLMFIWVVIKVVPIMFVILLILLILCPIVGVLSPLYKFLRKKWLMHNSVKVETANKKITMYLSPKTLKVRIHEVEKNHYKLHIDGDTSKKINIVISGDSTETINSSVIKVYVNGKSDNSRIYKLKDLAGLAPKAKQQSQNNEDEDDDIEYGAYFENEVEGYRIWFEDTYYKERYWGSF